MIFLEDFVYVIRQLKMLCMPWCMINLREHLSTLNALKPFGAKSNNYNEHT